MNSLTVTSFWQQAALLKVVYYVGDASSRQLTHACKLLCVELYVTSRNTLSANSLAYIAYSISTRTVCTLY